MDDDIVAEARSWLGVRWRHQGRTREGVDCIGVPINVGKARRGSTFDITDYERYASDDEMVRTCRQQLVEVRTIAPGAILVFTFDQQRHMAIAAPYLYGGLSIVHAYAPARRVVENRLDDWWQQRLRAVFRFPPQE